MRRRSGPPFTITLLNYIGIYALVALGLVLLTGVGGLTSFGQAAFVGIGAYATAWLTTADGASPWLGLLFALALTRRRRRCCSAPSRCGLCGHFLPLGTIAWGCRSTLLFGNLDALGGNNGITGVPPIAIGSLSLEPTAAIYYLIWGVLLATMLPSPTCSIRARAAPSAACRGGVVMAESLRHQTRSRVRLVVFVYRRAAGRASRAGSTRICSASSARRRSTCARGIEYLFMAMLGGVGHMSRARCVGAALVTLLQNALQDLLPQLRRARRQLRSHRVRRHLCAGAAVRARRRDGRSCCAICRAGASRAPPRPRRCRDAPCRAPGTPLLSVERLRKRFGGLVAVNDVSFDVTAGRDRRADRPERRRQEHAFNLHHRRRSAATTARSSFLGETITGAGRAAIARPASPAPSST